MIEKYYFQLLPESVRQSEIPFLNLVSQEQVQGSKVIQSQDGEQEAGLSKRGRGVGGGVASQFRYELLRLVVRVRRVSFNLAPPTVGFLALEEENKKLKKKPRPLFFFFSPKPRPPPVFVQLQR